MTTTLTKVKYAFILNGIDRKFKLQYIYENTLADNYQLPFSVFGFSYTVQDELQKIPKNCAYTEVLLVWLRMWPVWIVFCAFLCRCPSSSPFLSRFSTFFLSFPMTMSTAIRASVLLACEPQTYFRSLLLFLRRKRSNDRKYVCGSQATVLRELFTYFARNK